MLAQVVFGSVLHTWDCLSDYYVIYLWSSAGRGGFTAVGITFAVLTPALSLSLGLGQLRRLGLYHLVWPYVALTPLNMQNMVFAYLVLRARRLPTAREPAPETARAPAGLPVAGVDSSEAEKGALEHPALLTMDGTYLFQQFTFLKGVHMWMQSLPLAVATGVELLTGGSEQGFLVKFTSLALSVVSVGFAAALWSISFQPATAERAVELFTLICLDLAWAIVALGWIISLPTLQAGVALGVGFGVLWMMIGLICFDVLSRKRTDIAIMKASLQPFQEALGYPATLADDVVAGKRSAAWVLPSISFIVTIAFGAGPYFFDLLYQAPEPSQSILREHPTFERIVALVRRLVLLSLSITHLVLRFSYFRLWVSLGIALAHTYFTLRTRDVLRGFGIYGITCKAVCALLRIVWTVLGALAPPPCPRAGEKPRAPAAACLCPRPAAELELRAAEQDFFYECERIIVGCSSDDGRRLHFWRRSDPARQATEAVRKQVVETALECAAWVASRLNAGERVAALDVTANLLEAAGRSAGGRRRFLESAADLAKLRACIEAMCALMRGETVQAAPPPATPPRAPGGLRAISFQTAVDAAVWHRDCNTDDAFTRSAPAQRIDFFLSHSWHDPAVDAVRVVRTFLFLQSFIAVALVSSLLSALMFVPGGFIVASLAPCVPWWALSVAFAGGGLVVLAWGIGCHAAGARAAVPWHWMRTSFWFDKCCIDQSSDESKQAGIGYLGNTLERCDAMLVIFSDTYLQRLWCVYELAHFCHLMEQQRRAAELAGVPLAEAKRLLVLSLSWGAWWNPLRALRPAPLSAQEEALLAGYSCQQALCSKRSDKPLVLEMIRQEWHTLEAFDEYVRTDVRAALAAGKQAYFRQAAHTMWDSVVTLFS